MSDGQEQGNQDPNDNLDDDFQESSEDDIRSKIVDDYELDEAEQSELIDKIVQEKTEDQKKLSTAIKQKRTWREKFEKKPAETPQKPEEKPQPPQKDLNEEDFEKKLTSKIKSQFEEEKLNSLDLSDDLKKEVKDYAKLKDISIEEAKNSSFVQFMKKEEDDKAMNDKASISSSHKGGKTNLDFSEMSPSDFDLTTKEGRKDYAEWKKDLKSRKSD